MEKTPAAGDARRALKQLQNAEKAKAFQRFFKTGPGEYGHGDQFIGVSVPEQRKVAGQFKTMPLEEVSKLLSSPIHEHRLTALFILNLQFARAEKAENEKRQTTIFKFYSKHLPHVNNWDLVDSSAYKIAGPYLASRDRSPLIKWAKSKNLWKNRVAIVATHHFIKNDDFSSTLEIADILIDHKHDLIHKAVGWMLREVGNRERAAMLGFLKLHRGMPRTMLRYAIEKLPPDERKKWLAE